MEDVQGPSDAVVMQAASMITAILQCLQANNEIPYAPAFMYVACPSFPLNRLVSFSCKLTLSTASIVCLLPWSHTYDK
jgi:hypothetical protein